MPKISFRSFKFHDTGDDGRPSMDKNWYLEMPVVPREREMITIDDEKFVVDEIEYVVAVQNTGHEACITTIVVNLFPLSVPSPYRE